MVAESREKKAQVTETVIGRAMRALVLENDLLSTTVLLDQGADIYTLTYKLKDVDVLFKSPLPVREPGVGPAPAGDSATLWVDHYRGGWHTIFPNFGPAVEYKGALLDMHGEAARIPWQLEHLASDDEQVKVTLGVTLLRSPFRLRRAMSLQVGKPLMTISETVTNDGPEAMECMWGHHPTFGAPFLGPDCVIDTGARLVESDDSYDVPGNDLPLGHTWSWPLLEDRDGNQIDLSQVPAPGTGHSRVLFLKDFAESWYALTNLTLELGVGMVWDGALFPYACFWQETGGVRDYPWYGRAYATAIEPNSSYPGQGLITVKQKTGTQLVLEPGESRTQHIQVVFYEGKERVVRIDRTGSIYRVEE
jgi:galactose mutarotase-like enzyme